MSQFIIQKPGKVHHQWNLKNVNLRNYKHHLLMTSTSFVCDDLPGVEFSIISGMSMHDKVTVVVSKTSYNLKDVTIILSMNQEVMKTVNMEVWNDPYRFEDVYCCPYDYFSMHFIPLEIEITWTGSSKFLPNLYHDMTYFYKTSELSDVIISINDEEIPAHKLILAAHSPVFLAMFRSDMIESTSNCIKVKDIDIDIMKKVIEFLYTGCIDAELDVDTLLSTLSVADRYQIAGLKNFCEEVLSSKIAVDTVLSILEGAHYFNMTELIKKTNSFMSDNRQKIEKSEGFEDAVNKNPKVFEIFEQKTSS